MIKIKIFKSETHTQIVTSDGRNFYGEHDLALDFLGAISSEEEINQREITLRHIKKKSTVQLLRDLGAAQHIELDMIAFVLKKRGAFPTAEKKQTKKQINRYEALKTEARKKRNTIGKIVNFIPFRKEMIIKGVVIGIIIDKRVNRAYFRIVSDDQILYHTSINNSTLEVKSEATQEYLKRKYYSKIKKEKLTWKN